MEHIELIYFLLLVLQPCRVTGKDPDLVTGHVQGSVQLSYNMSVPVDLAIWDFSCNGKKGKVAEFIKQRFSITQEEFRSRMEWSNDRPTLMIRNLRMEDNGIYTAHMYDTENDKYELSYNLTVFELVPKPQIKKKDKQNVDGQCDSTLHCSVPSDSQALSYSWMYRYGNSEYHHYANGSTIHISSHNTTLECICLVQNPAHKNNNTYFVPACSQILMEDNANLPLIGLCGLLVLIPLVLGFKYLRNRRKMAMKPDIIYADIQVNTQKPANQNVPNQNGTDSKPLLYESSYADIKI